MQSDVLDIPRYERPGSCDPMTRLGQLGGHRSLAVEAGAETKLKASMYTQSAMGSLSRIIAENRPVSSDPTWFGF